jgi:hypothetical protein
MSLRGTDIALLAWLATSHGQAVPAALGTPRAVSNAKGRLRAAGLLSVSADRPLRRRMIEFTTHGLPYVFPPVFDGEGLLGIPTAWSAPPLDEYMRGPNLVWARRSGPLRGLVLVPLHEEVAGVARQHRAFHRVMALVDAARLGDARARHLVPDLLARELGL